MILPLKLFGRHRPRLCLFVLFFSSFVLPFAAQAATELDLIPAPDKNRMWGYVDARTRKTLIPPQFTKAGFFEDGLAIVQVRETARTDRQFSWGIIDKAGRFILAPLFSRISRAEKAGREKTGLPGLFVIEQGSSKGVFDTSRGMLVPPGQYDKEGYTSVVFFDKDYFRFGDQVWFDGRTYKGPDGYSIDSILKEARLFVIRRDGGFGPDKKGVMAADGSVIIPPKYAALESIDPLGRRWVGSIIDAGVIRQLTRALAGEGDFDTDDQKDGLTFYLMDGGGKTIREYRARYYPFVKDGRVTYESGGVVYEIAPETGEQLIRATDSDAGLKYRRFDENGLSGVKDASGNIVLEPKYQGLMPLGGSLFAARIEKKPAEGNTDYHALMDNTGVVDAASGQVLIPFEYRSIHRLYYPDSENSLLKIEKNAVGEHRAYAFNTVFGIADRTGKIILEPQFHSEFYMNRIGQAIVYRHGKHGVIDAKGKVIVPVIHDSVFDAFSDRRSERQDNPLPVYYRVQKDKKWAAYDASGRQFVPFLFGYLSLEKAALDQGWVVGEDEKRQLRTAYNFKTKVTIPAEYSGLWIHPHFIRAYRYATGKPSEYDILDFKGKKLRTGLWRLDPLASGNFIFRHEDQLGVLDARGRVVFSDTFADMTVAQPGYLWVRYKGGERFLINEKGEHYVIRE